MNWLIIVALAFGTVALAEFGDKTQIMTISLASKYKNRPVFWGMFLGMGVITVLGVVIGTVFYQVIPVFHVKIIAASIFIIFGIYSLYTQEKEEDREVDERKVFSTSFFLALVAELGDKTQLVVIALTARYQAPLNVLIGALGGLALVIGMGVFMGAKISEIVEKDKIELLSSLLFIILGIAFFLEIFVFG
ncbi:MAG: TMEM165/GDT1 family protein [Candidatus Saliniplasma sp.]